MEEEMKEIINQNYQQNQNPNDQSKQKESKQSQYKASSLFIIVLIIVAALLIAGIFISLYYFFQHHSPVPPVPPIPPTPVQPNVTMWYRNPYIIIPETIKIDSSSLSVNISNTKENTQDTEAKNIFFESRSLENHALHIKFTASLPIWELESYDKYYEDDDWVNYFQPANFSTVFKMFMNMSMPFAYSIFDGAGGLAVSTHNRTLKLYQNYTEFELIIPNKYIYGLGDHMHPLKLTDGTYILFNKKQAKAQTNVLDNGNSVHPFIITQTSDQKFMGISFNNLNYMEITINSTGDFLLPNQTILKITTNGGGLDFYFVYGLSPFGLIAKYKHYLGLPKAIPLWALGTQIYKDFDNENAINNDLRLFKDFKLPVDSVWLQKSLYEINFDFAIDQSKFPLFNNYSLNLKKEGIHIGVTIEPGLTVANQNTYYYDAQSKNLLMIDPSTSLPFVGACSNVNCSYLDYFNPHVEEFWKQALSDLELVSSFDAIQLINNEVSNPSFHDNGTFDGTIPNYILHYCTDYEKSEFYSEKYLHNLFNAMQVQQTYSYFDNIQSKRYLLVSDSLSPRSAGKAGKYIDNIKLNWENLKLILPSILRYQLMGTPYIGIKLPSLAADSELYQRLYMLSSILPMHRLETLDYLQTSAFKASLAQRYSLIMFYYTQIYFSYLYGYPVLNPLFYEFSKQETGFEEAAKASESQMIIGHSIMVCPILNKGITDSMVIYFPNENWFDLTGNMIMSYNKNAMNGMNLSISVGEVIPLFIKGGSIVFTQNVTDSRGAIIPDHVSDLLNIRGNILIAPDKDGRASGNLISDYLDVLYPQWWGHYRQYSFVYYNGVLKIVQDNLDTQYQNSYQYEQLGVIRVFYYNCNDPPKYACIIQKGLKIQQVSTYCIQTQNSCILSINPHQDVLLHDIESVIFGSSSQTMQMCGIASKTISNISSTTVSKQFDIDQLLHFNATLINNDIAQIKIYPIHTPYFDVQNIEPFNSVDKPNGHNLSSFGFSSNVINKGPFYFQFNDTDNYPMLRHDSTNQLVITANFTTIDFFINATNLYGLGERIHGFELNEGTYTLYARDIPSPTENGKPPGNNLYGSHPFLLYKLHNSKFGALLMLSSNPMDVKIERKGVGFNIHFIINGGIVNLFSFASDEPLELLRSYHQLIGTPPLLPLWAFGYHQCRYGYHSQDELSSVVSKFNEHHLPIDVLWTDIDYMYKYRDFTVDHERYPSMKEFVSNLKQQQIRFVPIIDGGIGVSDEYKVYKEALKRNLFIMSQTTNAPYEGVVWPGYSSYVDFLNPDSTNLWKESMQSLREEFEFDGIWLDMNEVSNFCQGDCKSSDQFFLPISISRPYEDLPYTVGHRTLYEKSISPSAYHYGDKDLNIELNLHNMYGHMIIKATNQYLTQVQKQRPFIIGRSTFPGTGKYGSHWLGDNYSNWDFLKYSIPGIFNFQMFGVPFTGSDVCGFMDDAELELCQRWMQLATFYPFFRNHNTIGTKSQEPYMDPLLEKIFVNVMKVRYSLIRYMYSSYYQLTIDGGSYFSPLFFYYPYDSDAYNSVDKEIMFGDSLLVNPILEQGVKSTIAYFPNDDWYDLYSGSRVSVYTKGGIGSYMRLTSDLNDPKVLVHIRGGSIIPYQNQSVVRITELANVETTLIVALSNKLKYFDSSIYYDDGMSLSPELSSHLIEIRYSEIKNYPQITFSVSNSNYKYTNNDIKLKHVLLYGVPAYKSIKATAYAKINDRETAIELQVVVSENCMARLYPKTETDGWSLDRITKIEWEYY